MDGVYEINEKQNTDSCNAFQSEHISINDIVNHQRCKESNECYIYTGVKHVTFGDTSESNFKNEVDRIETTHEKQQNHFANAFEKAFKNIPDNVGEKGEGADQDKRISVMNHILENQMQDIEMDNHLNKETQDSQCIDDNDTNIETQKMSPNSTTSIDDDYAYAGVAKSVTDLIAISPKDQQKSNMKN